MPPCRRWAKCRRGAPLPSTDAKGRAFTRKLAAEPEREGSMNLQRRDFLLLVTLAASITMPAWGQTLAPEVGPASANQSAASIPDLSGIWGHNWFAFEP